MTELEWLTCSEPRTMLAALDDSTSRRKLRLFACACCRRVSSLLTLVGSRVLEVADWYADQRATYAECDEAHDIAYQEYEHPGDSVEYPNISLAVSWAALVREDGAFPPRYAEIVMENTSRLGGDWIAHMPLTDQQLRERTKQANLLRDIFGNPFRPVSFSPEWRTSTAVAVAQGMYESRDFGAMPILADALQDAGCDSAEVLDHCRGAGPHVRGCWVADLVLGKG